MALARSPPGLMRTGWQSRTADGELVEPSTGGSFRETTHRPSCGREVGSAHAGPRSLLRWPSELHPPAATTFGFTDDTRAPLLWVSRDDDHIVPPALPEDNCETRQALEGDQCAQSLPGAQSALRVSGQRLERATLPSGESNPTSRAVSVRVRVTRSTEAVAPALDLDVRARAPASHLYGCDQRPGREDRTCRFQRDRPPRLPHLAMFVRPGVGG